MRLLGVALALVLMPLAAHAQYLPGFQGAARISLHPTHPAPGTTVVAGLESSLVDLERSSIVWRIDGKVAGRDVTSLSVPLGALGSQTDVSVDITTPEGSIVGADTVIRPTLVDILYEADSYVPPLYGGRALPSAGSHLRLEAHPHFVSSGGAEVASSDIIYTWRRNGQVLGSSSGRGRSTLVTTAPLLYDTDEISLEVESADGVYTGGASVRIPSADPVVRLYADHPLFGLRLDQALGNSTLITDPEMTFAAIPYFATVASLADRNLTYSWTVDGKPVDTSGNTPYELTLGAEKGGSARLAVSLSDSHNILFGADASWLIRFGASNDTTNPFTQQQ